MSTMQIKHNAQKAQKTQDVDEKLNLIAKALYEIGRTLDDIESKVNRIP